MRKSGAPPNRYRLEPFDVANWARRISKQFYHECGRDSTVVKYDYNVECLACQAEFAASSVHHVKITKATVQRFYRLWVGRSGKLDEADYEHLKACLSVVNERRRHIKVTRSMAIGMWQGLTGEQRLPARVADQLIAAMEGAINGGKP